MIVVLFQKSANFSEGCTATISTVYVKPVKQHEQTSVHGPDPAVSYAKKKEKKKKRDDQILIIKNILR